MEFVQIVRNNMKNKATIGIIVLLILIGIVFVFYKTSKTGSMSQTNSGVVKVVAAENFYGDITQQLGGNKVQVLSILSDPNADPHEYESSVKDAEAVSNANIVIENGLDYDTWMDKLLSASPNSSRVVLVGGKLASHPLPDNPHVWYGVDNVQTIAASIADALKS